MLFPAEFFELTEAVAVPATLGRGSDAEPIMRPASPSLRVLAVLAALHLQYELQRPTGAQTGPG